MGSDSQVDSLIADLALDEKLRLVRGRADPAGRATGYLGGVDRLDIPPLRLVDGPTGVRDGEATAFPATIALGAAWDPSLARRLGGALASEARAKGHHVLLAPGLNIIRVPTCGRNFEYLSEDPRLSACIAAAYVEGVEANGVGATAKHFVANNQERERDKIDVVADERVLREIYLPSFRAAVDAGVSAVMAAYNKVNGRYMSEHRKWLDDVLRGEWGFTGVTVSDWWGTHDAAAAAAGGLDLEMPGVSPLELYAPSSRLLGAISNIGVSERFDIDPPLYWRPIDRFVAEDGQPDPYPPAFFGVRLRRSIESGRIDEPTLDEKVRRVLTLSERLGVTGDETRLPGQSIDWETHHALAREVAIRGTVLLANDGVLPLNGKETLAVLGPNADQAKVGGGGSSEVSPPRSVSPVEGVRERAPQITFERGVGRVADPSMFDMPWNGIARPIRSDSDIGAAREAAGAADVAVVVVQDAATESEDRESMMLPGDQDRLVAAVAEVNPRTVVVCRSSGPVEMPWLDDVAAVVQTWYPGQADGEALGAVLYGEDPGGRLPVTYGHNFGEYSVTDERRYPGVDGRVHYEEGVFVGYRGFDRAGIDPLFPFGHGRSYATFTYDDVAVEHANDGLEVSVRVANTSDRPGREVVQAYVAPPDAAVDRPERELGGFASVSVDGGEDRHVELSVPRRTLARYDETDGWTVDPGEYAVTVGRSSRDGRAADRIVLDGASLG
ncbi:MAG: beta-glucosidase [Natronomonas sp.]|jgi:beta-glucosidase